MKPETTEAKPPVSTWTVVKKKVLKILYLISILVLIILGTIIYFKYYKTYSDGSQRGVLQKFSRKGVIFKTYEGEMILNSVAGSNNMIVASDRFFFSVTDKNLAKCLDSLQGRSVVVYYREKKVPLVWKGETPFYVDSVRVR